MLQVIEVCLKQLGVNIPKLRAMCKQYKEQSRK